MKYLDSIELLNYVLKKLKAGSREQVQIRDIPEIQQVISLAMKKMKDEASLNYKLAYQDLMEAFQTAQTVSAVQNLTEAMKDVLVDGVLRIKKEVAIVAWDYYHINDFEVNDQTIPIMRDVVETYLMEG